MSERLIFLPLGGAGEIGMNAYVFGYGPAGRERLILVDLGVTFPDMETTPGVDLIMADVSWLTQRADRLEAIFITHAHEDHLGGIGHLWPRLKAPVYTRAFTGVLARLKLEEQGLGTDMLHIVGAYPEQVEVGPFRVSFMPVSHSIPESAALVIDTPAGRVVHSGDFKLDGTPVVGEPFDAAAWHAMARANGKVQAFTCDSTNVFSPRPGRSEATLAAPLHDLVVNARGMVVATTFASNVARLKTLADAAVAAGRSVCLLGRAMRKMVAAAVEAGVLTDFPQTVSPEDAASMPRDNVMLIVTGSQGERRAAAAQLSRGRYLGLELKEGDLFLFSSRTIPGNERGVIRIMNALSEMGVDVVDDSDGLYHVSGHANRPDLEAVHDLVSARMVIPMHGEHRHLREHAKLVAAKGIPSEIVTNGMMMDLSGDRPRVVEHVETGRLYLDGNVLIGATDGVVRDRIRMALNGHVLITVIIDDEGEILGDPWAEVMGLPARGRSGGAVEEVIEQALADLLEKVSHKVIADDGKLDEAIRRQVRQTSMQEIGKKPEVTVVVSRLLEE
ncbi:MBL fold hydrolase [Haematobacter massiliensis]|uniref:Metallo-beta-lactamase n=1 Tax=Haematobacter massiliensis TaxID=195105 RepID=A0A086XX57_9RHOB|nr:ribonuclease J [Haematobacter massiliensis]KFI26607.1 metallo-beta-lactamase [Haematobacter massiliensis]OWJ73291.1 MBL fold hydrolase [Haematobacter massiliensis]OWJ86352.1 MBL fold hydrolase [Haematobacter massiliensis]QBJ23901.1 ribonuclease J [Haematobacter massiliensis]